MAFLRSKLAFRCMAELSSADWDLFRWKPQHFANNNHAGGPQYQAQLFYHRQTYPPLWNLGLYYHVGGISHLQRVKLIDQAGHCVFAWRLYWRSRTLAANLPASVSILRVHRFSSTVSRAFLPRVYQKHCLAVKVALSAHCGSFVKVRHWTWLLFGGSAKFEWCTLTA